MTPRAEPRVRLRRPLERSLRAGHPWIYREALEPGPALEPGTIVRVEGKSGRFCARGLAEAGAIAVRVLTTEDEAIDGRLFGARAAAAFALRSRVIPPATDAYRLLHGEGDRWPGAVCDRYGPFAVLKLDGEAACAWQERLTAWLRDPLAALGVDNLLVRFGRKHRQAPRVAFGAAPPAELVVSEHGMKLAVDLVHGQKTGLFLDHRESRRRVREIAAGARALNLYGYTGGFSVAAGLGGAEHVTTVDSAAAALAHAERSWALNGLDPRAHRALASDVPRLLGQLAQERARFDLVVADPPSFAPTAASKPEALASYAKLHAGALDLCAEGGYYLAASCSSHVSREEFEASLREGARRARRTLQLLERASAPADHPRLLAFPEGDYLKVTLLRVLD